MTHTNMKLEQALEIQALVDGQLEAVRKPEVQRLIQEDVAAAALALELSALHTVVRTHESALTVPESREFYWSQIQRRIVAGDAVATRKRDSGTILGWIRWLAPALGVAAMVVVISRALIGPVGGPVASADVLTFRSDIDRVTIHWIN